MAILPFIVAGTDGGTSLGRDITPAVPPALDYKSWIFALGAGLGQTGILVDGECDGRPIDILALLGDDLQQMIAQQAEQRHRPPQGLRGLSGEPHVLEPQRRGESRGPESCFGQYGAINLKS